MDTDVVKGIIESLLFVSDVPLSIDQMRLALEGVDKKDISHCLDLLKTDCEQSKRGIQLVEVAGGYQFVTTPAYLPFLKKYYKQKQSERLGSAALETLAIIAYKQPVTRAEIEFIRGVNIDGVMRSLLDKGLIKALGKKDVAGKPWVYGTTREFLEHFGLSSLKSLPPIAELGLTNKNESDLFSGGGPLAASEAIRNAESNIHVVEETNAVQSGGIPDAETMDSEATAVMERGNADPENMDISSTDAAAASEENDSFPLTSGDDPKTTGDK